MSQKVWIQGKKKVYEKPADPQNWEETVMKIVYRQLVCDRCTRDIKDGETVVFEQGETFHPLCRGRS